jgi:acyl-CoA reductase-like NAD-dependent aldehyde dehydrogenase
MTATNGRSTQALLKHPDCFYIGGKWVKPSSAATIDVIAPATEQLYMKVADAQVADIDRAVAAAREAFDRGPWPRMSHAERAGFLRAMGQKLRERADEVSQIWPNEMGILHSMAKAFVGTIGGVYEYYAGLADTFPFEERQDNPMFGGRVALIVREPVGVVGAIVPWNAAVNITAYKVAPALIAGCTVVLKLSPESPGAGYILAEIAESIGLPAGVLNVLTADRGPSERLVSHPGVDKISFTGSAVVGRRIAALCSERVARVTLELGGKSAGVVLDDFDIEAAAQAITGPACAMTGQICSSLTRIIVTKSRHDKLVEALSASFKSVQIGDPFDPATGIGPLASRRQRDRVEQLVNKAASDGTKLAAGGHRPAQLSRGFFFEPTVFANVDNNATIAREEVFGPVLCVIPAKDEAHAVELANDTVYGLNNSVFTNDPDRAYAVARQLRSGTVGHNIWRSDMTVGFGGFKQSGIGREGGVDGLRPYLEGKTVILDKIPSHIRQ